MTMCLAAIIGTGGCLAMGGISIALAAKKDNPVLNYIIIGGAFLFISGVVAFVVNVS